VSTLIRDVVSTLIRDVVSILIRNVGGFVTNVDRHDRSRFPRRPRMVGMLHEVAPAEDADAEAVLAAYRRLLQESIDTAGVETVRAETDLGDDLIETAAAGTTDAIADLSIEEAASILAVEDDRDSDTIVYELRDHLLMGMTTAVVDVDTLAGAIDADLTGQELQQALEGRARMTVRQLAEITAALEARRP
jgi:hypothetical protein